MCIAYLWLSNNAAKHVVKFKDENPSAVSSSDVIEINEDEKDSEEFISNVKKVYKLLKQSGTRLAEVNLKHFGTYICWRLETEQGESYNPSHRRNTTVESIGNKWKDWFLSTVKFSEDDWYAVQFSRAKAEYWKNALVKWSDNELFKNIQMVLPMCTEQVAKKQDVEAKPPKKSKQGNKGEKRKRVTKSEKKGEKKSVNTHAKKKSKSIHDEDQDVTSGEESDNE